MVVGILQFEVLIHDAESIKDKRRVVNSLKDRLHREFMVSIAEVGDSDAMDHALLAAVLVARDGARVGEVLDHITEKLRELKDAELGDVSREVIHGKSAGDIATSTGRDAGDDAALADEMLKVFKENPQDSSEASRRVRGAMTDSGALPGAGAGQGVFDAVKSARTTPPDRKGGGL